MAKIGNGRQSFDTMSIRTINSSHIDDESSLGSDSEINGFTCDRQTDKYGFIGGAQQYTETSAQDVPPEVLRQREVKWLDMLSHWDKWMFKRYNKVRLRCQKGIPPALRGRAWLYLSGGKVKKEQNYKKFEELDSEPGDPKWVDVIEKDLHRQFPFHEMFVSRGGHGQQDLFRVLKAYTLYRPDEGYCQAQAPIAAVLLMHMPAEDAFWGLVQICEKYLPGYYSPGLEAIQLDGEILFALLRRISPLAFRHLEKHKIDPILYMTEWFMCAFSRTLPWASVLRVWDMFLCDGVKIIFRVGLVLLKCMLGTREKLKACQGQYETMELLRAIEPRYMQEGFLVREILEVQVTARDVEKEHHTQLKRWKKNRGELNFKSPPRMHGARLIMLAEPPRRQDLLQNPTIVLENPQPTPQLRRGKEEKKSKKKSIKKSKPVEEIPNPYPLPNDRPPRSSDLPPPPPVNSENLESVPLTQLVSSENLESVPLTQLVSSENLESVPLTQLVSSENLESVSLTQLVSSGNLESVPLTQLVSSENLESVSLTQLVSRENLESVSLTQLVSSENLETVPLTKSESSENLESASLTQLVSSENLESVSLTQLVSSKNLETVPLTKSESSENLEYVTLTKSDSPHQQRAPPTDPPTTKESFLQHSTQSLSCTEQDTYL